MVRFWIIVVLAQFSNADILFLDFNASPDEIVVAQKAADERGEKLIVYPEMSEENRRLVKANRDRLDKLKNVSDTKSKEEQDKLFAQQHKLVDQMKNFSKEDLSAFLADKKDISTIILSGHHSTDFAGTMGRMSVSGLCDLKEFFPSTKTVFAAGCYTTVAGDLDRYRKCIPSLDVVGGYDNQSPLSDQQSGLKYLRKFLKDEEKVRAAKSKEDLRKIAKTVITHPFGAICTPGFHTNKRRTISTEGLYDHCVQLEKDTNAYMPEYDCYRLAKEERCSMPPEITGQESPLRKFYNKIQEMKNCFDLKVLLTPKVKPDDVIRLIHFRNVRTNFLKIYAKELRSLYDEAVKAKIPGAEEILKLDTLSRRQIDELYNRVYEASIESNNSKLEKMNDLLISDSLLTLKNIPFDWVEPHANVRSEELDRRLVKL